MLSTSALSALAFFLPTPLIPVSTPASLYTFPAEIRIKPQPHQALAPLAALIARGESDTAGGYNAANNGSAMDLGKHGLSRFFGRDCSQVTIGQVMNAQAAYRLHAVGRYQIIGSTLRAAVRWSGLKTTDYFTPDNQDRLFLALVQHKRPAAWAYLQGAGSIHRAAEDLAREWSSLPSPWGGSYYSGDRAHVSRAQLLSVLEQSKAALAGT